MSSLEDRVARLESHFDISNPESFLSKFNKLFNDFQDITDKWQVNMKLTVGEIDPKVVIEDGKVDGRDITATDGNITASKGTVSGKKGIFGESLTVTATDGNITASKGTVSGKKGIFGESLTVTGKNIISEMGTLRREIQDLRNEYKNHNHQFKHVNIFWFKLPTGLHRY